jgi:hypothetical protein
MQTGTTNSKFQQEEMIYCNIKIKQEIVAYNYGGSNYQLRAQKQKEAAENFKLDYFRTLNAVVAAGGVFCVDKYSLDSEYRMFVPNVRIKIPKKSFDTIKNFHTVEGIHFA